MNERLYFTLVHKWKYIIAIIKSKFYKKRNSILKKTVFVAREKDKDWIFGAKVRRLSKLSSLDASPYFNDKLRNLPKADGYYFIYQNYFCRALRSTPNILNKKTVVMFTHAYWTKKYSKTHVIWCLKKADYIICLNSAVKKQLILDGLPEDKLIVIHIAANPKMFYPHERNGKGGVGLCSNYVDRKNPELTLEVIKNMPDKHFYLIGSKWENFEHYEELINLPNFTYLKNKEYSEFPELYTKFDVFLSPSWLEGGPVPVLEAMLANCVPVTSKTGFCPDIIKHGKNGFLFDIDADYKEVIKLINEAYLLKGSIRETVIQHSWENAAKKIDSLFLS